jgi:hypothetical protein
MHMPVMQLLLITTAVPQEMYFRHLYATVQPSLEQRCASWDNYCALFNVILGSSINMQVQIYLSGTSTGGCWLLAEQPVPLWCDKLCCSLYADVHSLFHIVLPGSVTYRLYAWRLSRLGSRIILKPTCCP